MESKFKAVIYVDLLGLASLVEANSENFMAQPLGYTSSRDSPTNPAVDRLLFFHQVLESHISSEHPDHAMVFSDCAFAVFYTPVACADFGIALMGDFLEAHVPVLMGLGYGAFSAMHSSSEFSGKSTIVRSMFGGTSVVRAVAAENCRELWW
jgi:hypothetical protein